MYLNCLYLADIVAILKISELPTPKNFDQFYWIVGRKFRNSSSSAYISVTGKLTLTGASNFLIASNANQGSILPNFHFSGFPIFAFKLESL